MDLLELLEPTAAVLVHYDDYGLFTSPVSNSLTEVPDHEPNSLVRLLRRDDTMPLDSGEA